MQKDTLVTSSGVIRNRFKPRIGIVSANSLNSDFFDDCFHNGIDLSWESYVEETVERLKDENPGMDEVELDQLLDRETQDAEFDSHTYLLGAWVKNSKGQYEIDRTGKRGQFALSYNTDSNIVSVEWSVITKACGNTSPCFVMADGSGPCADLNSKGTEVIGYTLPSDMFRSNNE